MIRVTENTLSGMRVRDVLPVMSHVLSVSHKDVRSAGEHLEKVLADTIWYVHKGGFHISIQPKSGGLLKSYGKGRLVLVDPTDKDLAKPSRDEAIHIE